MIIIIKNKNNNSWTKDCTEREHLRVLTTHVMSEDNSSDHWIYDTGHARCCASKATEVSV